MLARLLQEADLTAWGLAFSVVPSEGGNAVPSAAAGSTKALGVLGQHLFQRGNTGCRAEALERAVPSCQAVSRLGIGIDQTVVAFVMALPFFTGSAA